MFEECNSLAELNAARVKAMTAGNEPVQVNNAYNERRKQILAQRRNYLTIQFKQIIVEAGSPFCSIPIAGRSQKLNTIALTDTGFLI